MVPVGEGNVGYIKRTMANFGSLEFPASNPADVTASRSSGTWIRNGTEHPMVVYVSSQSDGSAASTTSLVGHVNESESDVVVTRSKTQAADTLSSVTVATSITLVVPPGHHYKVVVVGTVSEWFEQELGAA